MRDAVSLRRSLGHPVIDSLVHTMEFLPVLEDFIHAAGGSVTVDRFRGAIASGRFQSNAWYGLSADARRRARVVRPAWWAFPSARTDDLAAISLPALLVERMPTYGVDFSIIYANVATFAVLVDDADLRLPLCRAVNLYLAELFCPYQHALCPAAAIPLFTPEEGIEELRFARQTLGLKVGLISAGVYRPIEGLASRYPATTHPELAPYLRWFDALGIDSPHDYDPFWAEACRLGVPLSAHRGTQGWTGRASVSNYTFNQIGHFAACNGSLARALFLGGVTRRFPELRVTFLEGGTGFGDDLLSELESNWKRRGMHAIGQFDPARLDAAELFAKFRRFGDARTQRYLSTEEELRRIAFGLGAGGQGDAADQESLDDFAAAGIKSIDDIAMRFLPNFCFGCQAEEFPVSAKVRAAWATDSGHWDVPDLSEALLTTWSGVESGQLSQEVFSDLVFRNAVNFLSEANAGFFHGTVIEKSMAHWQRKKNGE